MALYRTWLASETTNFFCVIRLMDASYTMFFSTFIWLSAKQFKVKFPILFVFCSPFMDGIRSICMVYVVVWFRWYYVNVISAQYMNQLPIQFLHIALAVSRSYTHIIYVSHALLRKKNNLKTTTPKISEHVQATQYVWIPRKTQEKKICEINETKKYIGTDGIKENRWK